MNKVPGYIFALKALGSRAGAAEYSLKWSDDAVSKSIIFILIQGFKRIKSAEYKMY